jgi:cytochrome P450 family 49 subfamily A
VLAREGDTKVASILALDLLLVGIDTVSEECLVVTKNFLRQTICLSQGQIILQTSTSVASVLYQLALHPEKQERLYKEICDVLPQKDAPLEATNIDNLKYLKACIKETLRFVKIQRVWSIIKFIIVQ